MCKIGSWDHLIAHTMHYFWMGKLYNDKIHTHQTHTQLYMHFKYYWYKMEFCLNFLLLTILQFDFLLFGNISFAANKKSNATRYLHLLALVWLSEEHVNERCLLAVSTEPETWPLQSISSSAFVRFILFFLLFSCTFF